jgi:hypothetical protein
MEEVLKLENIEYIWDSPLVENKYWNCWNSFFGLFYFIRCNLLVLYQSGAGQGFSTVIAATLFLAMYFCEIECRLANRNVLTFAVKWVRILNACSSLFYGMPCFQNDNFIFNDKLLFLLWYKCIHQIQEFDRVHSIVEVQSYGAIEIAGFLVETSVFLD